MTPAKWVAILSVGLLIAAPCFAGSNDEVVKTLTKLELDWANAVERNDVDAIGSFLHTDFTFTSPVGGIANRQDHLNDFRNGNSRFTLVALSEVEVENYGQMAVVTSRPTINGTVKVNGKLVTLRCLGARWTDALVHERGSWKYVARPTRVVTSTVRCTLSDTLSTGPSCRTRAIS